MPTEATYNFFLVAFCDGEFCWPIKDDWTQFSTTIFRCELLMAANMHRFVRHTLRFKTRVTRFQSRLITITFHWRKLTTNIGFTHLAALTKVTKMNRFLSTSGEESTRCWVFHFKRTDVMLQASQNTEGSQDTMSSICFWICEMFLPHPSKYSGSNRVIQMCSNYTK